MAADPLGETYKRAYLHSKFSDMNVLFMMGSKRSLYFLKIPKLKLESISLCIGNFCVIEIFKFPTHSFMLPCLLSQYIITWLRAPDSVSVKLMMK